MWIGENDTKTLVWMKIFCFVFAVLKTDTFEDKLGLMGPKKTCYGRDAEKSYSSTCSQRSFHFIDSDFFTEEDVFQQFVGDTRIMAQFCYDHLLHFTEGIIIL